MQLYYSPLACSLAARITFYEAGIPANFTYVNAKTKRTAKGEDFFSINPAGLVPTLRFDTGEVLTENSAILAVLDSQIHPGRSVTERARVQRWIGFINSELHTGCFSAILDDNAPPEVHAYNIERAKTRFALLDTHLRDRQFLTDEFTVADAYLFTIANWTQVRGPALSDYPALSAYLARIRTRPAVSNAVAEELAEYLEEQKAAAV